MPPPKNAFAVVPLSTIERVKRNVNPDELYGVSDSQQIERQYLRTLSKQRSDKWPNTLDVRISQLTQRGTLKPSHERVATAATHTHT